MAINVLPTIIANQIAAGEVVSRPASVVKELMENSIDAGATEIKLIVKDAGRSLVEVIDNGGGMDEEDCEKCFLPHATSKIKTSEDLHKLTTMGFRGEALSSIASIALVELKSRQENKELGTLIDIEGGIIKKKEPTLCSKGTDIKVKSIFFNTPARRNFLKSDIVENSHIADAFTRIALTYNEVAFSYYNNDKLIYKLDKANAKKRITDIFGNSFKSKLLNIDQEVDIVKIHGFISSLDLSRKNKNEEYFFVNNRFMKNNYLANAVERAYGGLLPEKNFPVFFISLQVNPKDIDVNIHPTKTEIKFLDDKIIYTLLYSAVRKALGQSTFDNLDFEKKDIVFPAMNKSNVFQPHVKYDSSYNPFANGINNTEFYCSDSNNNLEQTQISFSNKGIDYEESPSNNQTYTPFQIQKKYIVSKMHESIIIIDQHRASKNIIFNRLLNKENTQVSSQKLILPYNYRCDLRDFEIIKSAQSQITDMGFEIKENEDKTWSILAVPFNLSIDKSISLIEDYINKLHNNFILKEGEKNLELMNIAEKLAIPYGTYLSENEIMKLLAELFKLSSLEQLPNGEKVLLKIDRDFCDNIFNLKI